MRTRCERDANEMRKCEEIFRISRHDYAKNSSHFRICFVSASHLIRIWFASLHRPLGAFSSHSSSRFVFPPLWGHFGTNSEHAAYARVALPVGRRSLTANTQRTPTTISISKVTWGDRTRFPNIRRPWGRYSGVPVIWRQLPRSGCIRFCRPPSRAVDPARATWDVS